ncbi:hypothetical protein [Parasphingorhabdus pacifica]
MSHGEFDDDEQSERQRLLEELSAHIDSQLSRPQREAWTKAWSADPIQQAAANGPNRIHEWHYGQACRLGSMTVDPTTLHRASIEVLAQLPRTGLDEAVQRGIRTAAKAALDATSQDNARQTDLRRLRNGLIGTLTSTGTIANASDGVRELLDLLHDLF